MTAPQVPVALTANTEVRRDPNGNTVVVLRMSAGPMTFELLVPPDRAERFGQGVADMLRTSGEQAKALMPSIVVPPKGLFVPKMNGTNPQ